MSSKPPMISFLPTFAAAFNKVHPSYAMQNGFSRTYLLGGRSPLSSSAIYYFSDVIEAPPFDCNSDIRYYKHNYIDGVESALIFIKITWLKVDFLSQKVNLGCSLHVTTYVLSYTHNYYCFEKKVKKIGGPMMMCTFEHLFFHFEQWGELGMKIKYFETLF